MGIVNFPYRWLPRTAWSNVKSAWYQITGGISNLIRWAPIVWYDCDWDWAYLAEIMEYKLRRMANAIGKHGHHVGCKRNERQMRVCAELLKRLREDEYCGEPPYTSEGVKAAYARAQREQELLGRIIGKHLRAWWD